MVIRHLKGLITKFPWVGVQNCLVASRAFAMNLRWEKYLLCFILESEQAYVLPVLSQRTVLVTRILTR